MKFLFAKEFEIFPTRENAVHFMEVFIYFCGAKMVPFIGAYWGDFFCEIDKKCKQLADGQINCLHFLHCQAYEKKVR